MRTARALLYSKGKHVPLTWSRMRAVTACATTGLCYWIVCLPCARVVCMGREVNRSWPAPAWTPVRRYSEPLGQASRRWPARADRGIARGCRCRCLTALEAGGARPHSSLGSLPNLPKVPPPMYRAMSIFIEYPLLAVLPSVAFLGLYRVTRRPFVVVVALAWLLYGIYEYAMRERILCSGECNIRVLVDTVE